jgi:ABC-type multidrug transport system fused ATPase/permease subunit
LYSLIWGLLKPYRGSLAVVLVAMMLQMVATVAAPWPLKVVLDNVVGEHKLPHWLSDLLQPFFHHGTKMEIAAAAAIALVVIALVGAIASGNTSRTICGCGRMTTCNSFPSTITANMIWARCSAR